MGDPDAMLKPVMACTSEDVVHRAQLLDVPEALKLGSVHNQRTRPRQRNVTMDRIVHHPDRLIVITGEIHVQEMNRNWFLMFCIKSHIRIFPLLNVF
jgi:hypothetical protein